MAAIWSKILPMLVVVFLSLVSLGVVVGVYEHLSGKGKRLQPSVIVIAFIVIVFLILFFARLLGA